MLLGKKKKKKTHACAEHAFSYTSRLTVKKGSYTNKK